MITVINGKRDGFVGTNKIYIGRKNAAKGLQASPLANPYPIVKDRDRDAVVELYRRWLWEVVKSGKSGYNSGAYSELLRIANLSQSEDVKLVCYCKPKKCHGDVIVRCIKWLNDQS